MSRLVKEPSLRKLCPRIPAIVIGILTIIGVLKDERDNTVLADGWILGEYGRDDIVPVPSAAQLIVRVSSVPEKLGRKVAIL